MNKNITKKQNKWDEFYQNTPLENIPWQKTQQDFLIELINSGKVQSGTALDLGCGTGMKSIFLAKSGFKVTGVDISEKAIEYAKSNARQAKVKVDFLAKDATDLSFLADKKFDLVLDWANLHGIVEEKREKYINGIIEHLKPGGKLILRCFGRKDGNKNQTDRNIGLITLFSKEDIKNLYGKHFTILEQNISGSATSQAPSSFFYEFLMEKK